MCAAGRWRTEKPNLSARRQSSSSFVRRKSAQRRKRRKVCRDSGLSLEQCSRSITGKSCHAGLSLFRNFWKLWNVGENYWGQWKVVKKGPKSGKGREICVSRQIWLWQLNKMLVTKLFFDHHIIHLYFIRTAIHFSHVMFTEYSD